MSCHLGRFEESQHETEAYGWQVNTSRLLRRFRTVLGAGSTRGISTAQIRPLPRIPRCGDASRKKFREVT
jgi:hypothetical protein